MQLQEELRLLLLIAAAFVIGALVLFFKPDFRVEQNLKSNAAYYSGTISGQEESASAPEEPPQSVEF
jgi:hypothetical protein